MEEKEHNHGEIAKIDISVEMRKSYLDYAMSVIVARAIPDVCDGLKPVHRRILYAMHEGGFDYNKPFKKCAKIVGDVMGKYHPHGDVAIYDALVRMAQDFSMSVPLVHGQGNFGSIDNDPPAHMRYTEARMQKVSHTMLDDIDKDTVDFAPNYDGSETEPTVLPSKFPNLLVNGSSGIAVGMATNIPPHNLGEVIDGVIAYIDNPEITLEEMLEIIPGPDFPGGALILGRSGYAQAAMTSRGSIVMRGEAEIEETKSGRESIVISSIPYQVNKAKMVERIAELVKEKRIEGISDLRDESSKEGIRVVVELRRDANADVILNQIYSFTDLQSNFLMNMLALNNNRPESLALMDVIRIFTKFRKDVVTRRTNFLLGKARDKAHVLIGLRVAVNEIDEIVALIRNSKDSAEARNELLSRSWDAGVISGILALIQDRGNRIEDGRFYFTEVQARAILDMRLAKLTGLESEKIDEELRGLAKEIEEYLAILADEVKIMNIVKDEMAAIKNDFAVPRRTRIIEHEGGDMDVEDLIPREDMVVITTMNGYIKRVPLSSYRAQNRGGKGKSGITIHDEDYTTDVFVVNTHTPILFFSSAGKVYRMKTYKLPLGNSQSKGRAVVNILPLDRDETISTILPLIGEKEEWLSKNIVFATSKGSVRRNSMVDFENIQSNGKIAIKLEDDNRLVGVALCDDNDDVLLASKKGRCIRFPLETLRVFKSRNSDGVRGIKLDAFNSVISMSILKSSEAESIQDRDNYLKIDIETRVKLSDYFLNRVNDDDLLKSIREPLPFKIPQEILDVLSQDKIEAMARSEEFILTITENGYGKRSSAYEYRVTNRGGSGVVNIITSKRNGDVVASFPTNKDEEILMISDKGTMIRTRVRDIRISGRNTQGVTLMKAGEDEKVVSVARIVEEEEEENETEV